MKSPRIVHLAMSAMAVFGGAETTFADSIYSFTTIDVPGAKNTFANGINDSGQIVGSFDDWRTTQGFLATPTVVPEPGKLTAPLRR